MVFFRAIDIQRGINTAHVNGLAADGGLAGFDQIVFQIGIAQIPSVHGPGQIGRVAVPIKQIKRRRCFPFEVVAHHIIPDQIIGTQKTKGLRHIATGHQTALRKLGFAKFNKSFVYEHIQHACVTEVNQGGQQGSAGHGVLTPGRQHRQGVAEYGAAHTKSQGIDLRHIANAPRRFYGREGAFFHIVVPTGVGHGRVGVAPTHHKSTVALSHRIANE